MVIEKAQWAKRKDTGQPFMITPGKGKRGKKAKTGANGDVDVVATEGVHICTQCGNEYVPT